MQDLVVVETNTVRARIALAAAIVIALVFCWFAVRWQLGNMLAGLTDPGAPNASDVAEISLGFAPNDPLARWLRASAPDLNASGDEKAELHKFEDTVRGAPYDLRWRVELGRAYEQEDMLVEAESQFRKAVDLAPAYAFPRWHLANFYLRQSRNDEAIAELKRAAENNQTYRDQVFSLAWDFFGKNAVTVESLAGNTAEAKAGLAYFFAARGRAVDSLRNWNSLSDAEKSANPETAKAISHGLFLQHYYPQSLEFARQLGIDPDAKAEAVTNGSFEKGLSDDKDSRFGWQLVRNDPKFEAVADGKVKYAGERSLKITFRTYAKPALANLFQTVVVESGKRYKLSFWVRTEGLKVLAGRSCRSLMPMTAN